MNKTLIFVIIVVILAAAGLALLPHGDKTNQAVNAEALPSNGLVGDSTAEAAKATAANPSAVVPMAPSASASAPSDITPSADADDVPSPSPINIIPGSPPPAPQQAAAPSAKPLTVSPSEGQ